MNIYMGWKKALVQVNHDLKHLTEFSIAYYEKLLEKIWQGQESAKPN